MLRGKRILLVTALLLLATVLTASSVFAATGRSGGEVIIGPDEVIDDDLYVSGGAIRIDGTVRGDVLAFGGQLTINGTVEGDVLAGAQTIVINGTIEDDVRMGGQALQLGPNARIGDEVIAGGFSYESTADSLVGGELLLGAYQALLAGTIEGDVSVGTNALEIRGTIGGNVAADVGGDEGGGPSPVQFMPSPGVQMPAVPPGLTVTDSARIDGDVVYTSNVDADVADGAMIGGTLAREEPEVSPEEVEPEPTLLTTALDALRRFVTLLLVGVGLLWLAPDWTIRMSSTVESSPLPSLGWGIVTFILIIALIFAVLAGIIVSALIFGRLTLGSLAVLTFGLGGLIEAALVIGFLVFLSYVAYVVVGYGGGRWLLGRLRAEWATGRVAPLALGLVLLIILQVIPYLDTLVGLLVTVLGLGALWLWARSIRQPASASPTHV